VLEATDTPEAVKIKRSRTSAGRFYRTPMSSSLATSFPTRESRYYYALTCEELNLFDARWSYSAA